MPAYNECNTSTPFVGGRYGHGVICRHREFEGRNAYGYYECIIIEEVGDCWKVRFCGESETDLVQPPMVNMSKTPAPLMTKTMVYISSLRG